MALGAHQCTEMLVIVHLACMPNLSFLSGSNILVLGSDYNASLSSNWTELDWTGTELGNMQIRHVLDVKHLKSQEMKY